MEFISKLIQQYAEQHSDIEPDYLYQLNRYTHLNVLKPRMLSGQLQGRFIAMISKLINPEFVLDIGTYTGYSALCLAEGLRSNGTVHTIDNNEELLSFFKTYLANTPFQNHIQIHCGDANESIQNINQHIPHWDLIWLDADKENYLNYYKNTIDKLKPGGVILADNVLWSGKVIEETATKDKDTIALKEFNDFVMQDERVDNVLLPIRDGIMMIYKK